MRKGRVGDFLACMALGMAIVWGVGPGLLAGESGASDPGPSEQGSGERGSGGRPGGRMPPPEAFKACEGKAAGVAAQMSMPMGGSITGVCRMKDGRMVLVPDFMREGGRGR